MKVTILRGIPGSGKSTWIKNNIPNGVAVSADHYFMEDGKYIFNPVKLPQAHNECLRNYLCLLMCKTEHIVVDNTNVQAFEIAPYYRLAEVFNCEVQIVWIQCPIELGSQNIHGVPAQVIAKMALNFDPLPFWWNVKIITR